MVFSFFLNLCSVMKHEYETKTKSASRSFFTPEPNNNLYFTEIGHFTVVSLVICPLIGSEAGDDLVLIQTSLLFICRSQCSYAN